MVHGQSSGGVGLSTTRRHENRSRWVDRAVANFMSYVDDSLTNLRWNGWHRTGEINPAADSGRRSTTSRTVRPVERSKRFASATVRRGGRLDKKVIRHNSRLCRLPVNDGMEGVVVRPRRPPDTAAAIAHR